MDRGVTGWLDPFCAPCVRTAGWRVLRGLQSFRPRALCRARAFLLEQFREQYLEEGRARFLQSAQPQISPPDAAAAMMAFAADGAAAFCRAVIRSPASGVLRFLAAAFLLAAAFARLTGATGAGRSAIFGRLAEQSQQASMDAGSGVARRWRPQHQQS